MAARPVLVVGGGAVALRKIRVLLRCHARVTVVSPKVGPGIRRSAAACRSAWIKRPFAAGLISRLKPVLVFACTDSEQVNGEISRMASCRGIWVNRSDRPAESPVHFPAIARLGPNLCMAVFSGGRAPVYVKHLRKRIEKILGPRVSTELKLIDEFRRRLRARVEGSARRKRILTRLVEDGTVERVARQPAARRGPALRRLLEKRT